MNSYVVLTSLQVKCPWGYYSDLLRSLKNSLLGITVKKNSAAKIAANNQEATEDFDWPQNSRTLSESGDDYPVFRSCCSALFLWCSPGENYSDWTTKRFPQGGFIDIQHRESVPASAWNLLFRWDCRKCASAWQRRGTLASRQFKSPPRVAASSEWACGLWMGRCIDPGA